MIKKFIGKDIHGFLNVDIDFREQVTFLTGINGSGKTTVLRLIKALTCGHIKELIKVEFSYVEVVCSDIYGGEYSVGCRKDEDEIILVFKESEAERKLPFTLPDGLIQLNASAVSERIERLADEIWNDIAVRRFFEKKKHPFVMGLDRQATDSEMEYVIGGRGIYRQVRAGVAPLGYLDSALSSVEAIVHEHVRVRARRMSDISNDFKKRVLNAVFEAKPGQIENFEIKGLIKSDKEWSVLRGTVLDAAQSLGLNVEKQIHETFDGIQKKLDVLTSAQIKNTDPEWLLAALNCLVLSNQLSYFEKIVEYSNDYNKKVDVLRQKAQRFQKGVNKFLKESKKELLVDSIGDLKIKMVQQGRNKITKNIHDCSSGEKQLIIMLGNLSFLDGSKNMNTFIVDEPELSLHIAWQEIFVDALLESNPTTQFIIATHSPNIIAKLERRDWCVDLSKNLDQ